MDTPQDSTWQENMSDYNSDFSTPSDDDKEDDDFDEKNDGKNFNNVNCFTEKILVFKIWLMSRSANLQFNSLVIIFQFCALRTENLSTFYTGSFLSTKKM